MLFSDLLPWLCSCSQVLSSTSHVPEDPSKLIRTSQETLEAEGLLVIPISYHISPLCMQAGMNPLPQDIVSDLTEHQAIRTYLVHDYTVFCRTMHYVNTLTPGSQGCIQCLVSVFPSQEACKYIACSPTFHLICCWLSRQCP